MNIIALATRMTDAVAAYAERARSFFYQAVLSLHTCPRCNEALDMVTEGKCRCRVCDLLFDPTSTFQKCATCGGKPWLRIRRYECVECSRPIDSIFLFDGMVFDATYFQRKMLESRERKRERRERVRQMLAESRSCTFQPPPTDLTNASDLLAALDQMTGEWEPAMPPLLREGFDLKRYQTHVQAHMRLIETDLEQIPPLSEDARIDRIWRFIAIIFLAHAGILDVWQNGQSIMVKQRETNRERQDVSGNAEAVDGIQRPLGRFEA